MQTTSTTDSPAENGAGRFINLVAKDWGSSLEAKLDQVHSSTTVGDVVSASAKALNLPFQSFYQALFRGRELNHGDTLDEAGVDRDGEIELVPEVSAGSGLGRTAA